VGWRAWCAFAQRWSFLPTLEDVPSEVDRSALFRYFVVALRESSDVPYSGLLATTIQGYLSHVAYALVSVGVILSSDVIHTRLMALMLRGYSNADAVGRPLRLVIKIPLTFSILLRALGVVDSRYPVIFDLGLGALVRPPLWFGLRAALALGFLLSLRPSEYLEVSRPVRDDQYANSALAFFVWVVRDVQQFVRVWDVSSYLPSPPAFFLVFLDAVKNDARGKGGPRAGAPNPRPHSLFCCVTALLEFFRRYPPASSGSLFSHRAVAGRVTDALVGSILKEVARVMQVDESRLLPHSIRLGGPAQLQNFSDAVRMTQGNWSTVGGMLAYARGSLQHASLVASAMHDPAVI
jgi:hypothetical protein